MRATCTEIKLNMLPVEELTCTNTHHMLFIARFPISLPVQLPEIPAATSSSASVNSK